MDVQKIRKDFPILQREVNGHPLVYFDNAATSQTPLQVIDVIADYYKKYNSKTSIRTYFNIIHLMILEFSYQLC